MAVTQTAIDGESRKARLLCFVSPFTTSDKHVDLVSYHIAHAPSPFLASVFLSPPPFGRESDAPITSSYCESGSGIETNASRT